ncbi:hypothetical protein CIB93_30755 [Streptomyces sp. WZ.A104]|uniref:hypothetical protein n=1 Tax=Streptomyces sp. WZ.A104 TaxID=2023771 RepID=UPI000BBB9F37|nr:hypothetical protein [Streptomyces sp. WZ.A104]PCG82290.1 hypothetical protein CIB93_30755 [Streptomyces sp. WZ.A104]
MNNDTKTEGRPWSAERAPRRGPRPLTLVVIAIVVVTVAGLLIANLATSGRSDSPAVQTPSASGENKGSGSTSQEAGGELHKKDGVPVGYARTEAGAKAAASNFQAAQSTAKFLADKDARHKVTSVIMAPEAVAQRLKTLDEQTETAMRKLGILQNGRTADGAPLINRQATLAAQVTSFSKDLATVELWTAAVTGVADANSTLPPTSEFNQWNYTLRWVDGDWRAVTITRSAGLVPQATAGQPSSPNSFRELGGDADAAPYAG